MSFVVRDFTNADAGAFAALNLRWIEDSFGVEESDSVQLANPQASIIEAGGMIAIAELDGEVVGCAALVKPHHDPDDDRMWLELVKLATDPAAQGRGVAAAVLDYLIARARVLGCDAIWLETNERLAAATRLYRREGFRQLECSELWPSPYARCNLQMVLEL